MRIKMEHHLRIWALGYDVGLKITAADYAEIVAALRRIRLACDIEEKLDLLLENFREYEGELLTQALRESLFSSQDDVKTIGEIQVLNRRA
jgi:hypothetical protein